MMGFDINHIRAQFPALQQQVYGRPLVYLDSAATSQTPQSVIDAVNHYYTHDRANVHRGVHQLAMRADKAYESVREKVQTFIHAASREEIIFTKGTTESINLVAASFARAFMNHGDEIVISAMEHHANIVPWQQVCEQVGAVLKVIPVLDNGLLDMDAFQSLMTDRVKLLSVVHASNTLGTINPIASMIEQAHQVGAKVLIDAAQSVHHLPIDVQALDCDFLVFSSHKMYGPTGVGVLYGKRELLEAMPPYQTGGDMIREVSFEGTTFNALPYKFEAGTPMIASVIGLGAAIDFIQSIGFDAIECYEAKLSDYLMDSLKDIQGLRIIGEANPRVSLASFVIDTVHPHDLATILDKQGIAVRAGHHCTMPLMKRFNVPATTRTSLAVYNTVEEIDALVLGIRAAMEVFA